jgi:hypothetical protein
MRRLLLALLVSGTAILAVGQAPKVEAAKDCVHLRYYFYTGPGGTECGLMYLYCSGNQVQTGCETPYYTLYGGCACP